MTENNINRDNFWKFTTGHFMPCQVPDREPDYRSKSSSYWYSSEGVVRLSDHWGSGIASCSWQLGLEPLEPCDRNKSLGQRSGFLAWDGFRTPEATLRLTHQFGELDYDRLGSLPISTGHGPYGDFDVFAIRREWFTQDAAHYFFAGRKLFYRGGDSFTSALGDAYKDPQAQRMSIAWNEHRLLAKSRGEQQPDLKSWVAEQIDNPDFGPLARSLFTAKPSRNEAGYSLASEAKATAAASDSLAAQRQGICQDKANAKEGGTRL